jgi:hypothetical protein
MNKTINHYLGKKFGKLTVISYEGLNKHHKRIFKCRCTCTNIIITDSGNLNSGDTKSCGKCIEFEISLSLIINQMDTVMKLTPFMKYMKNITINKFGTI